MRPFLASFSFPKKKKNNKKGQHRPCGHFSLVVKRGQQKEDKYEVLERTNEKREFSDPDDCVFCRPRKEAA
jgi:hypothetical protein